jgi:hypothetical protein
MCEHAGNLGVHGDRVVQGASGLRKRGLSPTAGYQGSTFWKFILIDYF